MILAAVLSLDFMSGLTSSAWESYWLCIIFAPLVPNNCMIARGYGLGMEGLWRNCGFEMSSYDNSEIAGLLANAIAWIIAKIKNKMPADLQVGPAQILSGQKGGAGEWSYLFPISLVNTGNKPINKYSVQVKVPAYLLKAGDDGIYSLIVEKPGKELEPGKSVLIAQLELCLSQSKMLEHKETLKRDFILCTYQIEGFSPRERRLYLTTHGLV